MRHLIFQFTICPSQSSSSDRFQDNQSSKHFPSITAVSITHITSHILHAMAFFSTIPSGDFSPLFRLLDDYDSHRASSSHSTGRGPRHASAVRSFTPKFDVREHKEAYELQGELPGIDQTDIHIEFSDSSTLIVKGRVERSDSFGSVDKASGRITEAEHGYQKPTAEDEEDTDKKKNGDANKVIAKQDEGAKQQQPKYKYWVAERSVGEFHRSFTFPTRVDTDNVKAGLKDGVLTITVKKAAEPQVKKINID